MSNSKPDDVVVTPRELQERTRWSAATYRRARDRGLPTMGRHRGMRPRHYWPDVISWLRDEQDPPTDSGAAREAARCVGDDREGAA